MQNNITNSELQTYVEEQVILPDIQKQVELLIKSKNIWQLISTICETLSQIASASATILTFSSAMYDYKLLSFLAGSVNSISLLLLLFSNYANKKSNLALNELEKIPIINLIRQRI